MKKREALGVEEPIVPQIDTLYQSFEKLKYWKEAAESNNHTFLGLNHRLKQALPLNIYIYISQILLLILTNLGMAMELRGTASGRRLCFVVGVLLMVVSTQFVSVEGRVLKGVADEAVVEPIGMVAYMATLDSLSGSSRSAFSSLSFVLSSGPSKKGPGH